MLLLVLSICLTCHFRVTVSALLSLVDPAHQLLLHLLHLNMMYFDQIKVDLIITITCTRVVLCVMNWYRKRAG